MPIECLRVPAHGFGPEQEALNRLLRGCRIASVRKEFVADGSDSFWAFCVEYLDGPAGSGGSHVGNAGNKKPKVDYKALLSEADFALFSKLRALRKEFADREAIPAYAVFSNEQLAEIVKAKAKTMAALKKIDGVGEARVEKYGAAFVALMEKEVPPEQ